MYQETNFTYTTGYNQPNVGGGHLGQDPFQNLFQTQSQNSSSYHPSFIPPTQNFQNYPFQSSFHQVSGYPVSSNTYFQQPLHQTSFQTQQVFQEHNPSNPQAKLPHTNPLDQIFVRNNMQLESKSSQFVHSQPDLYTQTYTPQSQQQTFSPQSQQQVFQPQSQIQFAVQSSSHPQSQIPLNAHYQMQTFAPSQSKISKSQSHPLQHDINLDSSQFGGFGDFLSSSSILSDTHPKSAEIFPSKENTFSFDLITAPDSSMISSSADNYSSKFSFPYTSTLPTDNSQVIEITKPNATSILETKNSVPILLPHIDSSFEKLPSKSPLEPKMASVNEDNSSSTKFDYRNQSPPVSTTAESIPTQSSYKESKTVDWKNDSVEAFSLIDNSSVDHEWAWSSSTAPPLTSLNDTHTSEQKTENWEWGSSASESTSHNTADTSFISFANNERLDNTQVQNHTTNFNFIDQPNSEQNKKQPKEKHNQTTTEEHTPNGSLFDQLLVDIVPKVAGQSVKHSKESDNQPANEEHFHSAKTFEQFFVPVVPKSSDNDGQIVSSLEQLLVDFVPKTIEQNIKPSKQRENLTNSGEPLPNDSTFEQLFVEVVCKTAEQNVKQLKQGDNNNVKEEHFNSGFMTEKMMIDPIPKTVEQNLKQSKTTVRPLTEEHIPSGNLFDQLLGDAIPKTFEQNVMQPKQRDNQTANEGHIQNGSTLEHWLVDVIPKTGEQNLKQPKHIENQNVKEESNSRKSLLDQLHGDVGAINSNDKTESSLPKVNSIEKFNSSQSIQSSLPVEQSQTLLSEETVDTFSMEGQEQQWVWVEPPIEASISEPTVWSWTSADTAPSEFEVSKKEDHITQAIESNFISVLPSESSQGVNEQNETDLQKDKSDDSSLKSFSFDEAFLDGTGSKSSVEPVPPSDSSPKTELTPTARISSHSNSVVYEEDNSEFFMRQSVVSNFAKVVNDNSVRSMKSNEDSTIPSVTSTISKEDNTIQTVNSMETSELPPPDLTHNDNDYSGKSRERSTDAAQAQWDPFSSFSDFVQSSNTPHTIQQLDPSNKKRTQTNNSEPAQFVKRSQISEEIRRLQEDYTLAKDEDRLLDAIKISEEIKKLSKVSQSDDGSQSTITSRTQSPKLSQPQKVSRTKLKDQDQKRAIELWPNLLLQCSNKVEEALQFVEKVISSSRDMPEAELGSQLLQRVLLSPKAKLHFKSLHQIFLISQRIKQSFFENELAKQNRKVKSTLDTMFSFWTQLRELLQSNVQFEIEQQNADSQPSTSKEWEPSLCELCLQPLNPLPLCQINQRTYHCSCANFYTHCVSLL